MGDLTIQHGFPFLQQVLPPQFNRIDAKLSGGQVHVAFYGVNNLVRTKTSQAASLRGICIDAVGVIFKVWHSIQGYACRAAPLSHNGDGFRVGARFNKRGHPSGDQGAVPFHAVLQVNDHPLSRPAQDKHLLTCHHPFDWTSGFQGQHGGNILEGDDFAAKTTTHIPLLDPHLGLLDPEDS